MVELGAVAACPGEEALEVIVGLSVHARHVDDAARGGPLEGLAQVLGRDAAVADHAEAEKLLHLEHAVVLLLDEGRGLV